MAILLAVSGGIDSLYLANRASDLFPGEEFAVAHCNFHLRGEESDGDEAFVRRWCEERGVKGHFIAFDTAVEAQKRGISIEMAARELRYAWFAELCREHAYRAVAVAHNANDNAETLMLNLLRGTGVRGICGMSSESRRDDGLLILRPLLGTTRAEIEAWMNGQGQPWREDSSNASCEYKRNVIRHQVMPVLESLSPAAIRTLNADMERFAQAESLIDDYVAQARAEICDSEGSIIVDKLLALEHWELVLWNLLEHCALSGPTFDKMRGLLKRFKEEARGTVTVGGKSFQSPTCLIVIKGGKIRIETRN